MRGVDLWGGGGEQWEWMVVGGEVVDKQETVGKSGRVEEWKMRRRAESNEESRGGGEQSERRGRPEGGQRRRETRGGRARRGAGGCGEEVGRGGRPTEDFGL